MNNEELTDEGMINEELTMKNKPMQSVGNRAFTVTFCAGRYFRLAFQERLRRAVKRVIGRGHSI